MGLSVTIQTYPEIFFIIGFILCLIGFLFIFKNRIVAKGHQNSISRIFPFRFIKSGIFNKYIRARHYISGIILFLVGLVLIYFAMN